MRLTSLIILIAISYSICAQASLEFKESVFIEMNGSFTTGTTPRGAIIANTILNIPTGETVKITSIANAAGEIPVGATVPIGAYTTSFTILTMNSLEINIHKLPIWLPAGTYEFQIQYNSLSGGGNLFTARAQISGIKFEVIP